MNVSDEYRIIKLKCGAIAICSMPEFDGDDGDLLHVTTNWDEIQAFFETAFKARELAPEGS